MKNIIITLILVIPFIGISQSTNFEFSQHVIDNELNGSSLTNVIDLDGDGDKDVVSTGYFSDQIVWFENDGNENFTKHIVVSNFNGAYSIEVSDIDHDGDIDIWATAYESGEVAWFANDGNEIFTKQSFMTTLGVSAAQPLDFNGDGLVDFVNFSLDVLKHNYNAGQYTWYENTGSQTYITRTITTDINTVYVINDDFDQDQDMDYIVKDTELDLYYYYKNENGVSFQKDTINITLDSLTYFGNINDINLDGHRDILSFSTVTNKIYWHENDGTQNFTAKLIDSSIDNPYYMTSADFDKDGDIDIVASGNDDNELSLYLNDGNENFTKQIVDYNLLGSLGHVIVDLDGDYDFDIVANGFDDDNVLWYENIFDVEPRALSTPSNQNYIYTIQPQTEATNIEALNKEGDVIESIAYFDGLGRPMQSIAIQAGGSKQDVITHIDYDEFGRQTHDYLPYAKEDNLGVYQLDSLATIQNYYKTTYADDFAGLTEANSNVWSEKRLEASPLSRVLEQGAPGEDWLVDHNNDTDHTIKFEYASNATDEVKLFAVSLTTDYTPTLNQSIFYTQNELYKTITKDENWNPNQANLNDHTTEEFKDKQGRVVLKRTYNENAKHDTYYVYDAYGNLTYVLPPKMDAHTSGITTINSELDDLAYQYKYDWGNRLIEKKIPGKGREYIVYDNLDRPVLTQDAIQKTNDEWLFTKYDALGRVVYTGILSNENRLRDSIQINEFDTKTAQQNYEEKVTSGTGYDNTHYTNDNFPTSNMEVLTVNYYDDYDYAIAPFDPKTNPEAVFDESTTERTQGLATGSKVKVLTTTNWINTVTYYNEKGVPIYVHSHNTYLNTTDIVKTDVDFVGKALKTRSSHKKGTNDEIVTLDTYTYDHAGRLLKQVQCVGSTDLPNDCGEKGATGLEDSLLITHTLPPDSGTIEASGEIKLGPGFNGKAQTGQDISIKISTQASNITGSTIELIAENTYDELGQLESKKVGNTELTPLQQVEYTYNVRGWLKQINDPTVLGDKLFAFEINYNDIADVNKQLFNGNISQTLWKTANIDTSLKDYEYTYDALNRITSGVDDTTNYNLDLVEYDKNGNITKLEREGHLTTAATTFGPMDNLSYYYSGNQLHSVTDSSGKTTGFNDGNSSDTVYDNGNDDYSYDVNGNLLTDANKGITGITYNHLNLPKQVTFSGGNIQYKYDATGIKQKKIVSTGNTTLYAGNFVYEDNGTVEELKFFNYAEGYVEPDGSSFDYVYQYKDHLGNVRLSYSDADNNGSINASTEIIEESNYYPFGLEHKGYNNNVVSEHNYQNFQGQELTEDLGLNILEFRYRIHDPAIGRFWQIDPLGEEYSYQSPYNFAENRVIDGIELEGLEWMSIKDDDDNITGYNWVGYNDDGTAVEGSVGDAALVMDNGSVIHFTTQSGENGGMASAVNILTPNENGMVEMPESGTTFQAYNRNDEQRNGQTLQDSWGTAENVANFINLSGQYESQFRGDRLQFGDLSTETGDSPFFKTRKGWAQHSTHYNGSQADIRYTNSSGQTIIGQGKRAAGLSDPSRVQTLVNIANSLGMDHIHLGTPLQDKIKGQGVKFNSGHNDHIHIGTGNGKK